MLKKIAVDDLRIGMHVHELCGNWVDHPFWKTKFLLRDLADLAKLRASGVAECWIDTGKGQDVAPPAPHAPPAPLAPPSEPALTAPPREPASSSPSAPSAVPRAPAQPASASRGVAPGACRPGMGIEEELARAATLIAQSRELVTALFQQARMGRAVDTAQCLPIVADITDSVARHPGALISLARLKTHDDYSYMHSVAVCGLMAALARHFGADDAAVADAALAGLLHDVGKMLIPLSVLNKPGRLSDDEYRLIKEHPGLGHDLLRESVAVPGAALDVCLHHHERPDGKGYPLGLQGDALSHVAKMGSICDVYDAITSNRPYNAGWEPSESLARMAEWTKAGQFDATTFVGFLKVLGVYPVGTLVRLRSGRLGVVVEHNLDQLLAPRVKVFYSTRSQMPVPVEVLDTASSACNDAVVGRESNAVWKFPHLDELWAGRDVLARTARAA